MNWFLWALSASFCTAALAESNRIFKLNAQMLNAWRATIGLIFLGIAFPHMHWPHDSDFYIVAAIDGVIAAIGMILFLYLASKQTGRVSCMILPMAAFGAYVTWWMMEPLLRPDFIDQPFRVLLSLLSFTLVCISFQKIRENDASWNSFMIVLPVGLAFGVVNALTKKVMNADTLTDGLHNVGLAYAFVALSVCTVVSWIANIYPPLGGRPSGFFDRKLLWGGFWCGFWTIGMILTELFAVTNSPNPAYPSLILTLTPVWLFALNKIRGVQDEVSISASILILVGATGLLLSTV